MEFDIKELTITLMVGVFAILGFEAIQVYPWPFGSLRRPRFPRLFAKPKSHETSSDLEVTPHVNSHKEQTITVVLFIVIAFGIGSSLRISQTRSFMTIGFYTRHLLTCSIFHRRVTTARYR